MPRNFLTESLQPYPAHPAHEAQNWSRVGDALKELYDRSRLPHEYPGFDPGEDQILSHDGDGNIIWIPSPGSPGGGMFAYGGLHRLTNDNLIELPDPTTTLLEFPDSMVSSGVTPTTTSGSKLTIDTAGKYLVNFSGLANTDAVGGISPSLLGISFSLKKNGSFLSPHIGGGGKSQQLGIDGYNTGSPVANASFTAILDLAENDYLQIFYTATGDDDGIYISIGEPADAFEDAIGNCFLQIDFAQLTVAKIG